MVAVKGCGMSGFTRGDASKLGLLCKKAICEPRAVRKWEVAIPVTDFIVRDRWAVEDV